MRKIVALVGSVLFAASAFAANGEYGNHCAWGLTMGKQVMTDCKVSWMDPASHKTYCFLNEENKKHFAENTAANIKKADEAYANTNSHEGHDDHHG